MELKQMEKVAIKLNGKPILAYTIQTINDVYKFPKSVGSLGWFTTVAQDGKDVRHFCPCESFEREIAAITDENAPGKVGRKSGRPSIEERLMRIEYKQDLILRRMEDIKPTNN